MRETIITEGHVFVTNGTIVCPSRTQCEPIGGESHEEYVRRHCEEHDLGTFGSLADAERNLGLWCFYYASKYQYGNKSLTPQPFYETCQFISLWEWHPADLEMDKLWDASTPQFDECTWTIPDAAMRRPGEYRRFKELEVPRGCQKTTLGSKYYVTFRHLREYFLKQNKYFRVLIVSATTTLTSGVVVGLGSLWKTNKKIAELYGTTNEKGERVSIYGGKVEHGIVLRWTKNPEDSSGMTAFSVLHGGIGTETTGQRADLYVFDDGQTRKNVGTHLQREKVKDSFVEFIKQLDPLGEMLVQNTRKHLADFGGEIKREPWLGQFHVLHRRVEWVDPTTKEERLHYPIDGQGVERYSRRVIDQLYAISKERDFWAELMNWPLDPAKTLFRREDFQIIDPEDAPIEIRYGLGATLTPQEERELIELGLEIRGFVHVDPAGKEEQSIKGDKSAVVGLRFDRYSSLYVTNIKAGQWDSNRVWNECLNAWSYNRGQLVDYEMPASELHIRNAYAAWCAEKAKALNGPILMPMHFAHMPKSGKPSRIEQMVPITRSKKFFILSNAGTRQEIEEYIDQWCSYGVAEHDDYPDATSRVLRFVQPPSYEEAIESVAKSSDFRTVDGETRVKIQCHWWTRWQGTSGIRSTGA